MYFKFHVFRRGLCCSSRSQRITCGIGPQSNSFNEPNQPTNQLEAVEENTEYIDDDRTGEEPAFVQLKTELDELDPLTEGKVDIEKDDLFPGNLIKISLKGYFIDCFFI